MIIIRSDSSYVHHYCYISHYLILYYIRPLRVGSVYRMAFYLRNLDVDVTRSSPIRILYYTRLYYTILYYDIL